MNSLERVDKINILLEEIIDLFDEWTDDEIHKIDELFISNSKPSYLLNKTEDIFYELYRAIETREIELND